MTPPPDQRARQLIICCDGTNNNLTGGATDTNVVKFMQLIGDEQDQLLFYDPGVGNPGALPGATLWDTLNRKFERIAGLALGRGVYENISEAYTFLMANYRPGDELFFFGFSRGAFTARCVAGMVNQFGILEPQMISMVPTLLHTYFSERSQDEKFKQLVAQIRDRFAVTSSLTEPIHFVGVWDSVASVGAPPFAAKMTAIPTIVGPGKRFLHVRQALALDEHRAAFAPRLYKDENGTHTNDSSSNATMRQLWFQGAHCDIGGGYALTEAVLSDVASVWLADEARQCGLRLMKESLALTSEAEIRAALIAPTGTTPSAPRVHAETWSNCLWAVTGLRVRDPSRCEIDEQPDALVTPEAHPSVAALALAFPRDTEWAASRPRRSLLPVVLAAVLGIEIFFVLGGLLSMNDTSGWPALLGEFARSNAAFAHWQLGGWLGADGLQTVPRFAHPYAALLLDLVFIAVYSYLLAWFVVKGFAQVAGLGRARPGAPKWLNRLGWALPVAVIADLSENLFTALVIALHDRLPCFMAELLAGAMTLCGLVKLAAIGGVFVLIVWGVLRRHQPTTGE